MKKFLLAVMSLLLMPAISHAQEFFIDGIRYSIVNGEAIVAGVTEMSGDMVIPSEVRFEGISYDVTGIGANAFAACISLQTIDLPEGLTSIGADAFAESGLTSIVLPESVSYVGYGAFRSCKSLVSAKLSSALEVMPRAMFRLCESLESIEIPNGVTVIEGEQWSEGCFANCLRLRNVKLGENLKEIGGYTFYGCGDLSSIDLPNNLVSIGKSAFAGCRSLSEISIGESLETIGEGCFSDVNSLQSIIVDPSNQYFSTIDGILADKEGTELILAQKAYQETLHYPLLSKH